MTEDDIVELDTNYSEMSWREFLWEQRAWVAQFELAMISLVAFIATVDYLLASVELGMFYMFVFLGQVMFLVKLQSLKRDVLIKGGMLPRT